VRIYGLLERNSGSDPPKRIWERKVRSIFRVRKDTKSTESYSFEPQATEMVAGWTVDWTFDIAPYAIMGNDHEWYVLQFPEGLMTV